MDLFGNAFLAEIIANIFYWADKKVRKEIINPHNQLLCNERERVATLCSNIRNAVGLIPFIRSFSIQAHSWDNSKGDALFVFRYKEEVKVGIVEAKLLRFNGSKPDDIWDWSNNGESHFTNQVIKQQMWKNEAAVWDMFIPDCSINQHSPSLERKGSSNIWAEELINNSMISTPRKLWSYQDVLDAKQQYLSLYQIIKEILMCQKGRKHDITGKSELEISSYSEIRGKKITVPIPRNLSLSRRVIDEFFKRNESIDTLSYYRFDDVVESVKDYEKTMKVKIPERVMSKSSFNDEIFSEYSQIVKTSFLNHK